MDSGTKASLICIGVILVRVVIVGAIIFATGWSPPPPSYGPATKTEEDDEKPDVDIIANETEIEKYDEVQFEIGGNMGDRPLQDGIWSKRKIGGTTFPLPGCRMENCQR